VCIEPSAPRSRFSTFYCAVLKMGTKPKRISISQRCNNEFCTALAHIDEDSHTELSSHVDSTIERLIGKYCSSTRERVVSCLRDRVICVYDRGPAGWSDDGSDPHIRSREMPDGFVGLRCDILDRPGKRQRAFAVWHELQHEVQRAIDVSLTDSEIMSIPGRLHYYEQNANEAGLLHLRAMDLGSIFCPCYSSSVMRLTAYVSGRAGWMLSLVAAIMVVVVVAFVLIFDMLPVDMVTHFGYLLAAFGVLYLVHHAWD
jgi:hypothetical protein